MNKQVTEITDVEIIDSGENIDTVISNELVKHNITDAIINSLKEKFGDVKLRTLDDKEMYLEICEARKEVRKWGILCEKVCKKGREDAVATQKKWLTKRDEVLCKIAEVQDHLDEEIDKYEKEEKRKEDEMKQMMEDRFYNRQAQLLRRGAVYLNNHFVLDAVSFDVQLIKEADDEVFEISILPKYQAVYEKNEAEKVAQEKIKKEQEEKLRQEREEFERQQKEFREQQEQLRRQQEELQRQKDQAEAQERERQREEERQREAERQKVQRERYQRIVVYYPHYDIVSQDGLWAMSEEDFSNYLNSAKEKHETAQLERQKQLKEEAARQEREKIEREQREAEQKRLMEEQRRKDELEKSNDKVKYDDILAQLNRVVVYEMKSPYYRNKVSQIKEKLQEIKEL